MPAAIVMNFSEALCSVWPAILGFYVWGMVTLYRKGDRARTAGQLMLVLLLLGLLGGCIWAICAGMAHG